MTVESERECVCACMYVRERERERVVVVPSRKGESDFQVQNRLEP